MYNSMYNLRDGRSRQLTTFDFESKQKTLHFAPSDRKTVASYEGCGITSRMWITFPGWFWQHWNPSAPIDQTILRKFIIRIYFDGADFPSVESPVGDFFGMGHCEYKHYTSKYLAMSSGGFYCNFPMPFRKGIKIEFENTHDTVSTDLFLNVNFMEYDALPETAGYFHCQYLADTNNGYDPMVVIDTDGNGHFTGCSVSIQGSEFTKFAYLESPEFFYIDSEDKPSICGTGLEDYFNGGWYFRDGDFSSELYGVPLKDTLRSMITMYRFHEDDIINFKSHLRMEFDHPFKDWELQEFKYSSTAYYYLEKPTRLATPLPERGQLLNNIYRMNDIDHLSVP